MLDHEHVWGRRVEHNTAAMQVFQCEEEGCRAWGRRTGSTTAPIVPWKAGALPGTRSAPQAEAQPLAPFPIELPRAPFTITTKRKAQIRAFKPERLKRLEQELVLRICQQVGELLVVRARLVQLVEEKQRNRPVCCPCRDGGHVQCEGNAESICWCQDAAHNLVPGPGSM